MSIFIKTTYYLQNYNLIFIVSFLATETFDDELGQHAVTGLVVRPDATFKKEKRGNNMIQ